MFCAELMVSTSNGTLQEAPDVFNGVSVGIFHNVFTLAVSDRLMLSVMVPYTPIRRPIVGVDGLGFVLGVLLNEIVQGLSIEAVNNLESGLAATLDDSNDDTLVALVAFPVSPLFAADPSFVNLDLAAQLGRIELSHCGADAMAKIPCGFVRNPYGTLDLIGRDAFLGLQHQVDGDEPLGKRKVAVMKDGACRHGELIAA